MKEYSLFYVTNGSREEAEKVARVLVEQRLAACVNILPPIKSFFFWEGAVQAEEEVLLVGKTKTRLMGEVTDMVIQHHSYDLPCVVSWELDDGNQTFLQWIGSETR